MDKLAIGTVVKYRTPSNTDDKIATIAGYGDYVGQDGYIILRPLTGWKNKTTSVRVDHIDPRYENELLFWIAFDSVKEHGLCPQCHQQHP
jgi:hypothetical protein